MQDSNNRKRHNKNKCPSEHKVGDSWLYEDKTVGGMCPSAYDLVMPFVEILHYGGNLPWADDKDLVELSCPDPEVPVIYEVRRLR
ncbi:TIGR04076 family protein [Chloroflexota bacterium]